MSGYEAIEADERVEQGNGLEFKSFLENDPNAGRRNTTVNRGYLSDQPQRSNSFWTFQYYQQYFDVDTNTVLQRCVGTLLPKSNYVANYLSPSPDLYGPFWTLTTLIFSLFVFSSLASSIVAYLSDRPVEYNFQQLSVAVSLIYAYGLGLPALLWIALRYLGVNDWSLVEAIALWGYGQFVWIPVAVLCVIPVPLVRWVLVGIAFCVSGYFLVANVYPVLASAEAKATRALVIIIALLHAALALTLKVLFFSYYIEKQIGIQDPLGGETGDVPNLKF